MKAIKSFIPGSAGGPDGLRPQHLADMVGPQGGTLLDALTELMSLVLSGGVPDEVRPFFFGASLFAFAKKDGGVRPIAVGLTLRRLASKIANSKALDLCSSLLAPRQLGVGIKGGAEALAHAARRFLYSMKADEVLVKLDFSNAFNSIRRDAVLEATAQFAPALVPYVTSAYGSPSTLWYGNNLIESAEGLQQGDPLGPLLFCLSIHRIVCSIKSGFVSGYLDDLGVGGLVSSVITDIKSIEEQAHKVGLSLNHSKCEIISSDPSSSKALNDAGLFFSVCSPQSATLLGTPLHVDGVEDAVRSHLAAFSRAVPRLSKLSSHEALFLIKNSLAIPKLQYVLRTAPCFLATSLTDFDNAVFQALTSCINVALDSVDRSQLSLPVRWGGLGIRSAAFVAPSAFLASVTASSSLVTQLLPPVSLSYPDTTFFDALSLWQAGAGSFTPPPLPLDWDEPRCAHAAHLISSGLDVVGKARFLAGQAKGSGSWLLALPSASLGLRLSDEETRVAVGLRLGSRLVRGHKCICGVNVEPDGRHGLACRRSAGRHARHSMANDVIARAFRSLKIPVELEPVRLLRGDGKRPDGATLIPFSQGKCLVWDFTCPDTLAPSHLSQSSIASGSAASGAESRKRVKYAELARSHTFVPVAVETLGAWGEGAIDLTADLGRRLSIVTGDPRSTSFLRQRLDIAIQRGNSLAVRGTVPLDCLVSQED